MSHNLENNKILAAVLVAGIIAMLAGFIAKNVVHPHMPSKVALDIDTSALEATSAGSDAPVGPEPILALLATADVAKGEALSKACLACHTFEKGGANKIGPNLYGIVNNKKAHAEGFPYSDTLKEMAGKGETWNYQNLSGFLWKPAAYAKGTKMTYPGLKKPQDRASVIAYLRTLADAPAALPSDAEISAEAPKTEEEKVSDAADPKDTATPAPSAPGSTVPTSPEGISRGSDENPAPKGDGSEKTNEEVNAKVDAAEKSDKEPVKTEENTNTDGSQKKAEDANHSAVPTEK